MKHNVMILWCFIFTRLS